MRLNKKGKRERKKEMYEFVPIHRNCFCHTWCHFIFTNLVDRIDRMCTSLTL